MPRPERQPIIGEPIHFYEVRGGEVFGPLAAIVTRVNPREWRVNGEGAVNVAVLGEATLRFIQDVPFDDGGEYATCWWTRPRPVDDVRQNGL